MPACIRFDVIESPHVLICCHRDCSVWIPCEESCILFACFGRLYLIFQDGTMTLVCACHGKPFAGVLPSIALLLSPWLHLDIRMFVSYLRRERVHSTVRSPKMSRMYIFFPTFVCPIDFIIFMPTPQQIRHCVAAEMIIGLDN